MFWNWSQASRSSKVQALRDMLHTHDEVLRQTWTEDGRPYPAERLLQLLQDARPRIAASLITAARHLAASNADARELALEVVRATEAALIRPQPAPPPRAAPDVNLVTRIVERHGDALVAVHTRWRGALGANRHGLLDLERVWHNEKATLAQLLDEDFQYMLKRLPESVQADVARRTDDPNAATRAALAFVHANYVLKAPAVLSQRDSQR